MRKEFKTDRKDPASSYERADVSPSQKGDMHKVATKVGPSPAARAGSPGHKKVTPQRG
jgi:hypothetical protein